MIKTDDYIFEIYTKPQLNPSVTFPAGMLMGWRDEHGEPDGIYHATAEDMTGLAGEWIA